MRDMQYDRAFSIHAVMINRQFIFMVMQTTNLIIKKFNI